MKSNFFSLLFLFLSLAVSGANAAEFLLVANKQSPAVYLLIGGDITPGDYVQFVKQSKKALGIIQHSNGSNNELVVAIDSAGGSLVEAIKIGTAIREMRLATRIGTPFEIAQGAPFNQCMSACLFMLAGGIIRDGPAADFSKVKIGIHRPSFDSSYFAKLSVKDAEKKFKLLEKVSRKYLTDMGLSESFVQQMFAIPSTEMKFLDEEGFRKEFGNPPYYQEWIIANCGNRLNNAEEAIIAKYALAHVQGNKTSVSRSDADRLAAKDKTYRECFKRTRLADQLDSMQKYLSRM
jgi:hypothetical protein